MKTRILLVDDDADDRENFKAAIAVLGLDAELIYAENGADALTLITSPDFQPPQLIFMDLNMPKMNGLEVLKYLQDHRIYPDVPVIILSTLIDAVMEARCLALGARECMVKPMWFRPLVFQIRTAINKYLRYYFFV